MHERESRLHALIEPTVSSLGFELVGVVCRGGRSRGLIRIYIDHDEGVTVDDCARVSHRVNGLLDVEDPIPGEYDLEVSSPGADRPLFFEGDFARLSFWEDTVLSSTDIRSRWDTISGGLIPIPEPGTGTLFFAGLVILAARRRR